MWWNARSLMKLEKVQFAYYLLQKHNIDIAIISETWLSKRIQLLNGNYKWFQTKYNDSKGIVIISELTYEIIEEPCNEYDGCIKLLSLRDNNKILAFIIGCYLCPTNKKNIFNELTLLIKKIRLKMQNSQIILAGDFNSNSKHMENFGKNTYLKISKANFTFTRSQKFKDSYSYNMLDYILSNGEDFGWNLVNKIADSDHYPIIGRIKLKNISKSKKCFKSWKIIRYTNEENTIRLLKCNWPFEI